MGSSSRSHGICLLSKDILSPIPITCLYSFCFRIILGSRQSLTTWCHCKYHNCMYHITCVMAVSQLAQLLYTSSVKEFCIKAFSMLWYFQRSRKIGKPSAKKSFPNGDSSFGSTNMPVVSLCELPLMHTSWVFPFWPAPRFCHKCILLKSFPEQKQHTYHHYQNRGVQ